MYKLSELKGNKDLQRSIPDSDTRAIYDSDDNVLFGSRIVKGTVSYNYIPGELIDSGRPFFISSSISYNGEGVKAVPEGGVIKPFEEIKAMFPDNQ